jgi:putative solute:sodium symporter small subunit
MTPRSARTWPTTTTFADGSRRICPPPRARQPLFAADGIPPTSSQLTRPLTVSEGGTYTVTPEKRKAYWQANVRMLIVLLIIWFVVSYGLGIILVEPMNSIMLGGYPLGFWFAQQGAIYAFLVLIFIYAAMMNRLDKKFDVDE